MMKNQANSKTYQRSQQLESRNQSRRVRESFKLWRHGVYCIEKQRRSPWQNRTKQPTKSDSDDSDSILPDNNINTDGCETMVIQVKLYSLSGLVVGRKPGMGPSLKRACKPTRNSGAFRAIVGANVTCIAEGARFKTFLPSSEIKQVKVQEEKHQFAAYWGDERDDEDHNSLTSTIQITRKMKRVNFNRNIQVGKVPHFEHEHIELLVGVGQGTQMILLGEASIAVSGEEEAIVFSNVPVRNTSKTGGTRRHDEVSGFSSRSDVSFGLDNNATLRVGVRVLPRYHRISPKHHLTSHALNHHVVETIEIADDHSLLSSFSQRQQQSRSVSDVWSFLIGCVGIPFCMSERPVTSSNAINSVYKSRDVTEAEVTPLYLLSDVSESTYGSTEDEEMSSD